MTGPPTQDPAAVYRLLPALRGLRTLVPHGPSAAHLTGWLRDGGDPPEQVDFRWAGLNIGTPAEFACGTPGAPVLTWQVADVLGDELHDAGRLLPVIIDGRESPEYVFFLVEAVVDCVDERRSSKPRTGTRNLTQTVLLPDRLPTHLPAFRVPQSPYNVHWNRWAKEEMADLLGYDLETRLVWSQDPDAARHPHPWEF